MKLKAISIENFRPFHGSHSAEFSFDEKKPVTLFLAPNNHGKTTLFEAIKWGLYDEWPKISSRGDSVNTEAIAKYKRDNKPFKVSVEIDFEHENEIYKFRRWFKYTREHELKNKPDSDIYLSIIDDSGSQKKLVGVSNFQTFIDNILPEKVSKYFIVDGDDFRSFTDPTGDQTKDAIERLLNFTVYHNTIEHLESILEDYRKERSSLSSEKEIKDLEKEINGLKKDKSSLQEKHDKAKENRTYAYGNMTVIEKKLEELTLSKKEQDKIINAKVELDSIKAVLLETTNVLADKSNNFYKFLLRKELTSIYNEIRKLRQERFDIYPFNKQTLKDVIESCKDHGSVECLCGTKLKKMIKNIIRF